MEDHDYRCDRLTQLADWIREAAERVQETHTATPGNPQHEHPLLELTYQRADEITRYCNAMYVLIEGLRPERTAHSLGVDSETAWMLAHEDQADD